MLARPRITTGGDSREEVVEHYVYNVNRPRFVMIDVLQDRHSSSRRIQTDTVFNRLIKRIVKVAQRNVTFGHDFMCCPY